MIFDRDGVLAWFDVAGAMQHLSALLPLTLPELLVRWEAWGRTHGFPTSMAEEERFFTTFWAALCVEFDLDDERCRALQRFRYTTYLRAYDDAHAALTYAREHGWRIGVLSNFALASLDASLHAIGLAELVDVACAATVIGAAKPDAAAYLITARRLGVEPSECLYIDDEEACVRGALAVGMTAFHLQRGPGMNESGLPLLGDLRQVAALVDGHSAKLR